MLCRFRYLAKQFSCTNMHTDIHMCVYICVYVSVGFPSSAHVKNLLANAWDIRDMDSVPGLGRSPGGGNGNPL